MSQAVTVSNGREFFRIEQADLADAMKDGFYRPFDHGQTIVGNGEYLFEVPIADVEAAEGDGLRELLAKERDGWARERGQADRPVMVDLGESAEPVLELPDASMLVDGLSQAELTAEAERQQVAQELAETQGWRWYSLWIKTWLASRRVTLLRQLRGSGISAVVHVAILLILASLIMKVDDEPKGILLSATPTTDEMIDEVIIEPTPLEITEPTESTDSAAPAEAEVIRAEMATAPDFLAAVSGDAVKPPARPAAASGAGKSRPTKRPSFFGKRVAAVNYVFVIDNSNSMTGGRFETALNELVNAVNQLTAKQRFYVIFYSDTAYPMFHPKPATRLAQATPKNKQMLRYWLDTVQLCLKTNGKEAIRAAFALEPDVIFVLGDGAFTDGASQYFAARPQEKIPLHTLGMEVKPNDVVRFRQLAEAHGGTYKDVGVMPLAREAAKRNPRPRNKARGPVWGIKLPVK